MPIYTYRCENCGVQFDRQQSFKDQPLTTCPECSTTSLRKVISPVGVVFKGSGWYATDHRSPSGTRSSKSENDSKTESKSETKTETPAAPASSASTTTE